MTFLEQNVNTGFVLKLVLYFKTKNVTEKFNKNEPSLAMKSIDNICHIFFISGPRRPRGFPDILERTQSYPGNIPVIAKKHIAMS